jgi:P pilus assembly chaperone PapD
VHFLYDLPAGFMLWSEFEATCGLPGIFDGDSDQSVVLLRNHHSKSEWLDVWVQVTRDTAVVVVVVTPSTVSLSVCCSTHITYCML